MKTLRRWARRVASVLVTLIVMLAAWVFWNLHDRSPGSDFRLDLRPSADSTPALRVGFGRRTIDPDLSAKKVWLAGFDHGRAATSIHDHIYAVASVIDDGEHLVVEEADGVDRDDADAMLPVVDDRGHGVDVIVDRRRRAAVIEAGQPDLLRREIGVDRAPPEADA